MLINNQIVLLFLFQNCNLAPILIMMFEMIFLKGYPLYLSLGNAVKATGFLSQS